VFLKPATVHARKRSAQALKVKKRVMEALGGKVILVLHKASHKNPKTKIIRA